MDWVMGIQRVIDYVEEHITEALNYNEIARQSYSTSYHFQRVFGLLCGYTLGEYIRNRRLTLRTMPVSHKKHVGLRKRIASEWLPSSDYILTDRPEIVVTHWYRQSGNEKRYIELWIPVEKK